MLDAARPSTKSFSCYLARGPRSPSLVLAPLAHLGLFLGSPLSISYPLFATIIFTAGKSQISYTDVVLVVKSLFLSTRRLGRKSLFYTCRFGSEDGLPGSLSMTLFVSSVFAE
jgi:hypothetical protein